jgi:hypothetical protein
LVGTGVGVVQTEANNLYYNQNNSLIAGGLTGGTTTMLGFAVGDKFGGVMAGKSIFFQCLPLFGVTQLEGVQRNTVIIFTIK